MTFSIVTLTSSVDTPYYDFALLTNQTYEKHKEAKGLEQKYVSRTKTTNDEPTIAPSMEMDELDEKATEEEIRNNNYTPVTKLFIDRVE